MNPVREAILGHQARSGGIGTCVEYCLEDVLSEPDEEFKEYVAAKSMAAVVRSEWKALNDSHKKKGTSLLQGELMLSGLPCPSSLSYRDDVIPGGYRTVLTQYASVYQLLRVIDAHGEQTRAFNMAHEELEELGRTALRLADGNQQVLLCTIADDFFQASA